MGGHSVSLPSFLCHCRITVPMFLFVHNWLVSRVTRLYRNSSTLVDFKSACAKYVHNLILSHHDGKIIARVIDKSMSVGSRLSCSFSPGKSKCNNRHTLTFVLGYHPGFHKSGLRQVLLNILHDYGSTINDLFGGSLSIRIAWSNILPPAHVRLRNL